MDAAKDACRRSDEGGVANAGRSSQQGAIHAESPAGTVGVGGGAPAGGDADVEGKVAGAKHLFALSAGDCGQGSAAGGYLPAADAAAVSGSGATTLFNADLADRHPEFQVACDMNSDAGRSMKTATEEDDEGVAGCGGDSCHSASTAADAAGVVSGSYGSVRPNAPSLTRLGDAAASTTPDGTVQKLEPANVEAPSVPQAESRSTKSIDHEAAISPPAVVGQPAECGG